MIPTLLLLGLIVGSLVQAASRRLSPTIIGVAVFVAVAWGVGVGIDARSFTVFVGGLVLALANLAVGAAVGGGMVAAARWLHRRGGGSPAQV